MTNQSIKLAQLWVKMNEIKETIDNEILPLGGHLDLERDDNDLFRAFEELSGRIENHLTDFQLQAKMKRN